MGRFTWQQIIEAPCENTSEAHAERARELVDAGDVAFGPSFTGGLMGPAPVLLLADSHANVALALKAVGR